MNYGLTYELFNVGPPKSFVVCVYRPVARSSGKVVKSVATRKLQVANKVTKSTGDLQMTP